MVTGGTWPGYEFIAEKSDAELIAHVRDPMFCSSAYTDALAVRLERSNRDVANLTLALQCAKDILERHAGTSALCDTHIAELMAQYPDALDG